MTVTEPASVAIRDAVRSAVAGLPRGALVLVACSGGADSLALAAATAWLAPRLGLRAGAVIVDHGLQSGSAGIAERAAAQCRDLGLDPVEIATVRVEPAGEGPEAAARAARYAALDARADALGAALVLLGHTRDDQAEQVLLALTRGAGTRSLAAMPPRRDRLARPLLDLPRQATRDSCAELRLTPWEDPHNGDERYLRVRARRLLADLEDNLGPGIAAALARSAAHARVDADHLDAEADAATAALGEPPWPVTALEQVPPAVRGRLWRRLLIARGAPAGGVTARHTDACERLLTHWHGQGPITLPGGIAVSRREGRIEVAPTALVRPVG